MTKNRTLLSVIFLFISGAVFGAVCLHVSMRWNVFRAFHHRPPALARAVMHELNRELELTDEQKRQLKPIVQDLRKKVGIIRKENAPKIILVIDEAAAAAEKFLTPDQQEKLKQLVGRVKEHFGRLQDRDLPGPPDGAFGPPPHQAPSPSGPGLR